MFHRVQHSKNYTVLDNGFLRNRKMLLKARGLLATILSLPNDWRFSIRGLAAILPDGRASIENTVQELEKAGHIRRPKQKRGERGRFLPGEWDVYERPVCKGQALADQQADVAEGQVGTDGGNKRVETWPVAGTTVARANVPAGDYYVVVVVGDPNGFMRQFLALGENGWKVLDGKDPEIIKANSKAVTVEAGKTVEVPNDGFGQVANEQFDLIEKTLTEQYGGEEGAEGQTE